MGYVKKAIREAVQKEVNEYLDEVFSSGFIIGYDNIYLNEWWKDEKKLYLQYAKYYVKQKLNNEGWENIIFRAFRKKYPEHKYSQLDVKDATMIYYNLGQIRKNKIKNLLKEI